MKKNEIFEFDSPNGNKVKAVVVDKICYSFDEDTDRIQEKFLCYSQNRLFIYIAVTQVSYNMSENDEFGLPFTTELTTEYEYCDTIVDYCIIPELDIILKEERG